MARWPRALCMLCQAPVYAGLMLLPVYLDTSLAQRPHLVLAAGTHHEALRMTTHDYLRVVRPIVTDFVVHGPEPSPEPPAPVPFT